MLKFFCSSHGGELTHFKKMFFSVLFYNTKESTRTVMNKNEKKRRIIFVGNFPPEKDM
jgi:hypothetical protein